eukprot:364872_1
MAATNATSTTDLRLNNKVNISIWKNSNHIDFAKLLPEDIIFEWTRTIHDIKECNQQEFLYVVSKTIDNMNLLVRQSNDDTKLLINKPLILSYLHQINTNGNVFWWSKNEFINNIKNIIFNAEKYVSNYSIHAEYAQQLFSAIYKYDISSIQSSDKKITFYSKYTHFNPSLRRNISSLITTLDQYHHTSYLNTKIEGINMRMCDFTQSLDY